MKFNTLYITEKYIFIPTENLNKTVYIKKMTESSRKRVNKLLGDGKVSAYICIGGTIAISRV
jgi:hypothetical protein